MTSRLRTIVLTGPAIIRDAGCSPDGHRLVVLTTPHQTDTLTVTCQIAAPPVVLQAIGLYWFRARHATRVAQRARRRRGT